MGIQAGTHRLGPQNARLAVHTRRRGAAAKAGHDLEIDVTSWEGTLHVDEDPSATSIELAADATSLRVHRGTGGMQALTDDDKASIAKTIDDEVLKGRDIAFRSTEVTPAGDGGHVSVVGDLTLAGTTRLGPVRSVEGRRRCRDRPGRSVAVDGLGVEPALDTWRQSACAVGVEGDLLDRLDVRRVAAIAGDPRALRPGE